MSIVHQASCFLCKNIFHSPLKYDVNRTYSAATSTLLSSLIENVVKEKLFNDSVTVICTECYKMLNELDLLRKKTEDITQKLFAYVNCECSSKTLNAYSQTDTSPLQKLVQDEPLVFQYSASDAYVCKKCGQTFADNESLKNHLKTHVIRSYECPICKKTFLSKNGADIHLKRQHVDVQLVNETTESEPPTTKPNKERTKRYQCSECPKTWKTPGELKLHMTSHSEERPYVCEICGQTYKHKSALDVHVGMHNGVNPFTCEYCGKAFTQKGALQRHLPIHTGEASYQCDICGRTFVHHSSFSIHRLSHTGEKSYKCDVCGLALVSTSHLKRHRRIHTGEKNYGCVTCGKRFAEKYNLATHRKLHEQAGDREFKRKFRCQHCELLCDGRLKLSEHMLKVHPEVELVM